MNDFEKIEHLLLSKRFEELSPTEVNEVNSYFENANDYNDMRDTLMQVKSTLAADKLLIKPNVDLKEKLLKQFDKTYTNSTSSAAGKTRPFYKSIAFQWSAAASVVIIVSISIFSYINQLGGAKSDKMAINYESKKESPSQEKADYTTEDKDGTGNTGTTTDGKEKVIVVNPEAVNEEVSEDQPTKKGVYGNYFVNENTISEGESDKTSNAPVFRTNTEVDALKRDAFGDNSNVGGVNTNVSKEEKKDADRVLTNAYRDENLYKIEDNKTIELNTTIPTNSQSQIFGNTNTTVNKNQLVNKKDYWNKKKNLNKNRTKTDNNKGKTNNEDAIVANDKDSMSIKTDSLKLDSNQNLLEQQEPIQMDDNKKKDE